MTLLIIYAVVSIFFSFLCSILEAVLLSVTPTFLKTQMNAGNTSASILSEMKKDVDQPLIAILTLNTLAHTVGAILVGVQAESLPYKVDFFGINMVGIVSAIMTLLILIVSEIIPKTIGATYWKSLTGFTARSLQIMVGVLKYTGILFLLKLTTKLVGKSAHVHTMSREDFIAIADTATTDGVFDKKESRFIKNLMRFSEVQVKSIMTPRTVIVTAPSSQKIRDFFESHRDLRFSRIPIYDKDADDITSYVLKDDVLRDIIDDKPAETLGEISRELMIVNRDTPIPELFDQMMDKREHIALVVDEYGTVSGVATMEDVIETLLGLEIVDESDRIADMQELARRNWETRSKNLGIDTNKES